MSFEKANVDDAVVFFERNATVGENDGVTQR
jgi:hypothetical protein